jgi:hypothetical protein
VIETRARSISTSHSRALTNLLSESGSLNFDCDPNKSTSGHVETFGGAIDTLRALVVESAHRVTGVASFILLADIGDQCFRALNLNFEGGDQRIVRVNDNVSRFPLKSKADRKLHLWSPTSDIQRVAQ